MTLRRPTSVRGIGLASGRPVSVELCPARPGTGLLLGGTVAAAGSAAVAGHVMCLGDRRGRRVRMVEHLLAACAGIGITDLVVTVSGGELPFGDGSSRGLARAMVRAGLVRLGAGRPPLRLRRPLLVEGPTGFIAAVPAAGLRINCLAESPGGGRQLFAYRHSRAAFERELAGARTFGPAPAGMPPERMRRRLRLRFRIERVGRMLVPARRRWPDETSRHKVLDLLGDLYLLGRPLHAELFVLRPGHRLNLDFVRGVAGRTEVR